MRQRERPTRRAMALSGFGLASIALLRPAGATPAAMAQAIRQFKGEAKAASGGIVLDLPPLVENGNTVSLGVRVNSPMTEADHVKRIAIFNEKNPQPNVLTFHFTPRSGRAQVAARVRLADSQRITAIAELSDGRYLETSADVVVTLAACLEG